MERGIEVSKGEYAKKIISALKGRRIPLEEYSLFIGALRILPFYQKRFRTKRLNFIELETDFTETERILPLLEEKYKENLTTKIINEGEIKQGGRIFVYGGCKDLTKEEETYRSKLIIKRAKLKKGYGVLHHSKIQISLYKPLQESLEKAFEVAEALDIETKLSGFILKRSVPPTPIPLNTLQKKFI